MGVLLAQSLVPSPPEFSRHSQQGQGFAASGPFQALRPAYLTARPPPSTEPLHRDKVNDCTDMANLKSSTHGSASGILFAFWLQSIERRCAITGERTFPVLDAAHIMPYSVFQRHELSNGLLMRSDLHRLFDEGYITVHPADRRVVVSERIREGFENGKEYYRLHGSEVREPIHGAYRPRQDNLEYHAHNVFR